MLHPWLRMLEKNVARQRQRAHDGRDGRHDARCVDDVVAADAVEPVTAAEPSDDGLIVAIGHVGVAEDAVVDASVQGFYDLRQGSEVHIGHPEGQHVVVGRLVPLHAVGVAAGYDFVEVVSHFSTCKLVNLSTVTAQLCLFFGQKSAKIFRKSIIRCWFGNHCVRFLKIFVLK